MMPMTPSGTRTREISRPLGRVHCAATVPMGSGSWMMSSSPAAMAATRFVVEFQAIQQRRGQLPRARAAPDPGHWRRGCRPCGHGWPPPPRVSARFLACGAGEAQGIRRRQRRLAHARASASVSSALMMPPARAAPANPCAGSPDRPGAPAHRRCDSPGCLRSPRTCGP